jgi:hypothetical protein
MDWVYIFMLVWIVSLCLCTYGLCPYVYVVVNWVYMFMYCGLCLYAYVTVDWVCMFLNICFPNLLFMMYIYFSLTKETIKSFYIIFRDVKMTNILSRLFDNFSRRIFDYSTGFPLVTLKFSCTI